MKKLILMLILSGTIFKNAGAQTTSVTDTLAYLQTIVASKANYIGQPFSVLMNSLQMPIKSFIPFASVHFEKNKETSTSFSFHARQTGDDYYSAYPLLRVSWVTPLNAEQSKILWKSNNCGLWSQAAIEFYSTGIISDIQIRE